MALLTPEELGSEWEVVIPQNFVDPSGDKIDVANVSQMFIIVVNDGPDQVDVSMKSTATSATNLSAGVGPEDEVAPIQQNASAVFWFRGREDQYVVNSSNEVELTYDTPNQNFDVGNNVKITVWTRPR